MSSDLSIQRSASAVEPALVINRILEAGVRKAPNQTITYNGRDYTYREFEERVGTITTGRGAKTAYIRRVVERRILPFSISEIETECPGISRDMIRVVLRQLRTEGVLQVRGRGRGAKWSKVE